MGNNTGKPHNSTSVEADMISELSTRTKKNTEPFTFNNMLFICKVIDVYDGDTVTIAFKHPMSKGFNSMKIRMYGYDSPEMKPPLARRNRDQEKKDAIVARDALREKVLNKIVLVYCGRFDLYGRLLATIYTLTGLDEKTIYSLSLDDLHELVKKNNVNEWMLLQKYGWEYTGGTRKSPYE